MPISIFIHILNINVKNSHPIYNTQSKTSVVQQYLSKLKPQTILLNNFASVTSEFSALRCILLMRFHVLVIIHVMKCLKLMQCFEYILTLFSSRGECSAAQSSIYPSFTQENHFSRSQFEWKTLHGKCRSFHSNTGMRNSPNFVLTPRHI